jgi:hypothetical protein
MGKLGRYRKAIVAVIGAALEIIPLAFGSASWAPPVIAVLTAAAVLLTPNTPAIPAKEGSTP